MDVRQYNARRADDINRLQEAKPIIRSVIAFLSYLRFGPRVTIVDDEGDRDTYTLSAKDHYQMADEFLSQLEVDLTKDIR